MPISIRWNNFCLALVIISDISQWRLCSPFPTSDFPLNQGPLQTNMTTFQQNLSSFQESDEGILGIQESIKNNSLLMRTERDADCLHYGHVCKSGFCCAHEGLHCVTNSAGRGNRRQICRRF